MLRRQSILLCILAALALAGTGGVTRSFAAELGSGPLESAIAEPSAAEKAEEEANRNAKASSSSGPSAVVIIAIVGGVLLLGIAFLIVRDARKVAPVTAEGPSGGVSPETRAAELRRRRSKAKAAKRQRKRNR